jgi:hypothetical protein
MTVVEKGCHISRLKHILFSIKMIIARARLARAKGVAAVARDRRRADQSVMHRRTGESGFPRGAFPGSFRLMRERPGGALHRLVIFPRRVF